MRKLIPSAPPGCVWLNVPFNEDFNKAIKQYPGVRWVRGNKRWAAPVDCLTYVENHSRELGIPFSYDLPQVNSSSPPEIDERAFQYQHDGILRAWHEKNLLVNWEMGLGKSILGLILAKNLQRTLVICPASIKGVWEDEAQIWAPKLKIQQIRKPKDWNSIDTEINMIVCSYGMLVDLDEYYLDLIICDEAHYLKNPKAWRTKKIKMLCANKPQTRKLLLTGTPISKDPKDLHPLLDILYPGRFGNLYQFTERYSNVEVTEYGRKILGLNSERETELRERLAFVTDSKTKGEVSHLLPAFSVQGIRVGRDTTKLDQTVELVRDAFDAGERHVIVLAHYHNTAKELRDVLTKYKPEYLDGETHRDVDKRRAALTEWRARDRSLIVATIESVAEGIDLTWNSLAIVSEMTYKRIKMLQLLGRFSRLSGKTPSKVLILNAEATDDELMVYELLRQTKEANKLYKAGDATEKLYGALDLEETDEQWQARARAALKVRVVDEYDEP